MLGPMRQPQASERVGLCVHCAHSRSIHPERGGGYWLCELSRSDPRFRKYSQLPVRSCAGLSPQAEAKRG